MSHSPVKDTVVVNDRWGSDSRCKHGGYYTCHDRYNPGELHNLIQGTNRTLNHVCIGKLVNHKYENAMTIQKTSWGYIRNTNISGYLTIHDLLYELVTTVRYVILLNK